jgi:hypothetical protein
VLYHSSIMTLERSLLVLFVVMASCLPAFSQDSRINPAGAELNATLERVAHAERIPSVLLKGLAFEASHWQQWLPSGAVTELKPGYVGIMGVPIAGREDADRLRNDWKYNVDVGAKRLALMYFRSPIIGNGNQEEGRNILECWYLALGRYSSGKERTPENTAFTNSILDAIASGGAGRWAPVMITRPSPDKLAWGRGILGAPVPWHFGDVVPRPAIGQPGAEVRVDLPIPYLSQVWDSPDTFDGGGACGPTSMLMVLAYYHKLPENPVTVRDSYLHVSRWGGHLPDIEKAVCSPGVGAVHARMLDYLRPYFPDVAIYYDAKATYARVRRELDAGRPVILGTEVTPAGHLMVARGYLTDGRLLCNDPAGNYYEAAVRGEPRGSWSPTGNRYWNGDGERATYDWEALSVRWVMTFGGTGTDADHAEDEALRKP